MSDEKKPPYLMHGKIFFGGWMAPDPRDPALGESMHTARYALASLTQQDAYRILSAAEAYCHFADHPAPTRWILEKLRVLRRAVRTLERPCDEEGDE